MPGQSPEERLERYRAKRDFSITAEPAGTTAPATDGHRFVVQRHRARRLHYDLRLEAAGVLVSWAVPKGPTLDADVRRMAVHVEDHPLDYFDFEGVIPAGEYGGGDVVVWDWGTWSPVDGEDPVEAVADGNLHFDLDGEKLHGRFVLVRTKRGGERDWMLIKKHDEAAVTGWDPEDHPRSVKSGRTNDEVKASPSASWTGHGSWAAASPAELEALDDLGAGGTWTVGGEAVRLRRLGTIAVRARDGQPAVTRRDLVRHAATAAPVLLPHLVGHGVGIDVDDTAGLIAAVAGGAVELAVDRSGWAVIALGAASFDDVLVLARLHRTALAHLGVDGRPVLDGLGGIEIRIPVVASAGSTVEAWTRQVGEAVAASVPDVELRSPAADGDLLAPFSPRRAPGAPVVVPLAWDELDDPDPLAEGWTVATVAERIATVGDPLGPAARSPPTSPDPALTRPAAGDGRTRRRHGRRGGAPVHSRACEMSTSWSSAAPTSTSSPGATGCPDPARRCTAPGSRSCRAARASTRPSRPPGRGRRSPSSGPSATTRPASGSATCCARRASTSARWRRSPACRPAGR